MKKIYTGNQYWQTVAEFRVCNSLTSIQFDDNGHKLPFQVMVTWMGLTRTVYREMV